jgi:hypothetical protein
MPATPTYGLPYPGTGDSPHGPNQLQALAEEVEAELVRVDGDIAAHAALVKPVAHLRQTVAQSVASATYTACTFTTEDLDTVNGHSTSSNTSRWTVPSGWAGAYMLSGGGKFATNATGFRSGQFAKNGSVILGSEGPGLAAADTSTFDARTVVVSLAVGDYVEMQIRQSSGGSLNTDVAATSSQCTMSVVYLGPTS